MKSIYKPMKIQALIVAVIASFIVYGCEDNEANCLELSESSFSNVDGDGATLTVSVTSDVEWQISKTAQWCNVTPGKGSGNQTLTLQIEANPDSKERKVTVTVASPATKMSRKIEITQAGWIYTHRTISLQSAGGFPCALPRQVRRATVCQPQPPV